MEKILLVEDEANFGAVLRDYLQMNDYDVTLVEDGEAGWKAYNQGAYRLCILDVMMPKKDGFTLAKEIRERDTDTPIIFLTARSLQEDVLKGFKTGADDYITKPFDSEELLLRIRAILKRTQQTEEEEPISDQEEFEFGEFHFHHRFHQLTHQGETERLSPKESDLLRLLLVHRNDLLTRETALRTLWGDDNYFNARSMDVFISKLRKRFKVDPRIKIDNVHGKGFCMIIPE
ncbi:response regulator transcription factor [Pontibacter sp. G13]|uniref:response regulator transcription factor n=1 Tax=Pontibacter sp. G13 TaxID=3074898 RepID=UPI00288BEB53|nr:response regulator transcription factor [Pontibacter sp. G13]WNJ15986.1 response regulator transcription factor [Pontibacter sp. G13]